MQDHQLQETIISTEEIFKGHVVKLAVHTVRLPNGETGKREVVHHPGAVALVALEGALDGDQVLLVRQYRTAASQILYEIPAGTLNPGENVEDCAIRELQEETGYKPGKLEKLAGFFVAPGYTTEYIQLFLATELSESRLNTDDDEFVDLVRMPLREALLMIERGEIVDGKSIIGLLQVARQRGQ
jgi:ADP-ribose pyrophosphatase